MARIELANGKGVAVIDDDDVGRVGVGWYRHTVGYAMRRAKDRTVMLLHRVVMNAQRGQEVDHVNHDKLDCRKANLRFVTHSQNHQNRPGAQANSRTGVRGVIAYRTKKGVRFRAGVQLSRKLSIYRYGLMTLEEAAAVAIELRRTHFTHSPECMTDGL